MPSASPPSLPPCPPAPQLPAVLLVHPQVAVLVQHFADWRHDYCGESGHPVSLPGRLVALGLGRMGGYASGTRHLSFIVEELLQHELMCWNAWDPASGERWHPFAEPYHVFKLRFPRAEPLVLPCTPQRVHELRQFFGVL